MNESQTSWESMTPEEKKRELFLKQKKTLDLFFLAVIFSSIENE